jgi:pSer/pThr/pTyr-binding forkhead associated (FHA) protein
MIPVLIAALLIAIGVILFFVVKQGGFARPPAGSAALSAPAKAAPKSGSKAPAPVEDDEESTTVRVIGPRLIRLQKGIKVGNEIPIIGIMTIGSGSSCKIRLDDPHVSDQHLDVRLENGKAYVVDAGSETGTDVNSLRLSCFEPRLLADGDRILAGSTEFLYRSG